MTHNISLATCFNVTQKHLKRNIRRICKSKGIGHVLATTQVNDLQKRTFLYMDGDSETLYALQKEIIEDVQAKFPGVEIEPWQEMICDTQPLNEYVITPTKGCLSEHSSGFKPELKYPPVPEKPESKWSDYFDAGFIQTVTAFKYSRQVIVDYHSAVDSLKAKFIHVTYRQNTVYLDIGTCLFWPQVLEIINSCKKLQILKSIKEIYFLVDGMKSYVQDWYGLKPEGHYYVETEDDVVVPAVASLTTMEDFFEKLRTERKRPESDIEKVKALFSAATIQYEDVMTSGKNALTHENLKEIGLKTEVGLRIAILELIEKNQKK